MCESALSHIQSSPDNGPAVTCDRSTTLQILLVSLSVILAAACSGQDGAGNSQQPLPVVIFPQIDLPSGIDHGREHFVGQLVLQEGCLRAEATSHFAPYTRTSTMLIWPRTFSFSSEDGVVRIVDATGRVAAHVGDHVRFTGSGGFSQYTLRQVRDYEALKLELSSECRGPYEFVGHEFAAISLTGPTKLSLPDPKLFFPRQPVYQGGPVSKTAEAHGKLVLDGHCLRLKNYQHNWNYVVIWPPGFTPHIHRGVVHVRNSAGQIIAQVGDELYMGGGGHSSSPYEECPGLTWEANSITVLPDVEVYFPKQDGTLGTDQEMERFEGKLVLYRRCLEVDDVIRVRDRVVVPGGELLLIWPDTFTLDLDDEVARIVDESGRIVARVGDDVEFSAVSISYQEAMDHTGLREIAPACSGGYWVVGDDFAAVPDPK